MAGLREDCLGAVIDRFYEAAIRPSLWPEVLREYSTALGAEGALILPGSASAFAPVYSANVQETVAVGVREGWYADNPRVTRGVRALRNTHDVVTESRIFSPRELDHIPFNAEFIGKQGFRWFAGAYLVPAGAHSLFLSAERRADQDMFSHREIEQIARTLPHIQRAGQIALRLAEARADGILEAFDLMECGAALLDARGTVIRVNAKMNQHIGTGLNLVQGRLAARHPDASAALDRLVASVVGRRTAHEAPALGAVAVPSTTGQPLVVHAAPLVASAQDVFGQAQAVLLVHDPARQASPVSGLLRQAYGLTPAEARLAQELALGRGLGEIALSLGVTVATLRVQLKTIFTKTDTHRQAQLVHLLARLPPPTGTAAPGSGPYS